MTKLHDQATQGNSHNNDDDKENDDDQVSSDYEDASSSSSYYTSSSSCFPSDFEDGEDNDDSGDYHSRSTTPRPAVLSFKFTSPAPPTRIAGRSATVVGPDPLPGRGLLSPISPQTGQKTRA